MNIKSKFIISACAFVLLICVSLNIVLLCTPVFGTYSHTYNDGSHATFTFYENTYTYVAYDSNGNYIDYAADFYIHLPNGTSDSDEDILLLGNATYLRNSVFSFSSRQDETIEYTNGIAIFLQTLLGLFDIASGVLILVVLGKVYLNKKHIRDKMHSIMKNSLDKYDYPK